MGPPVFFCVSLSLFMEAMGWDGMITTLSVAGSHEFFLAARSDAGI